MHRFIPYYKVASFIGDHPKLATPVSKPEPDPVNTLRGDYDVAQVCLNCTKKKCRGSEECYAKMKRQQEAEKVETA